MPFKALGMTSWRFELLKASSQVPTRVTRAMDFLEKALDFFQVVKEVGLEVDQGLPDWALEIEPLEPLGPLELETFKELLDEVEKEEWEGAEVETWEDWRAKGAEWKEEGQDLWKHWQGGEKREEDWEAWSWSPDEEPVGRWKCCNGMDIRSGPHFGRRDVRGYLWRGESFEVSEEQAFREGYGWFLKLADGRGWVFSHGKSGVFCVKEGGERQEEVVWKDERDDFKEDSWKRGYEKTWEQDEPEEKWQKWKEDRRDWQEERADEWQDCRWDRWHTQKDGSQSWNENGRHWPDEQQNWNGNKSDWPDEKKDEWQNWNGNKRDWPDERTEWQEHGRGGWYEQKAESQWQENRRDSQDQWKEWQEKQNLTEGRDWWNEGQDASPPRHENRRTDWWHGQTSDDSYPSWKEDRWQEELYEKRSWRDEQQEEWPNWPTEDSWRRDEWQDRRAWRDEPRRHEWQERWDTW